MRPYMLREATQRTGWVRDRGRLSQQKHHENSLLDYTKRTFFAVQESRPIRGKSGSIDMRSFSTNASPCKIIDK